MLERLNKQMNDSIDLLIEDPGRIEDITVESFGVNSAGNKRDVQIFIAIVSGIVDSGEKVKEKLSALRDNLESEISVSE